MTSTLLHWTSIILSLHILLKPLVFFLPYQTRRNALDKSYHNKASASETQDNVMLVLACTVAALVLSTRDTDLPSFISGAWIGACLIQGYFHRFKVPLSDETRPLQGPQSPIKTMSYAVQATPEKGWKELVLLGGIAGVAVLLHLVK